MGKQNLRPSFSQLIDLKKVRELLEAHYRVTGIISAILDLHGNILVAVGWEDICVNFHRKNPQSSLRCRESDAYILGHLLDFEGGCLDYRCRNGLQDVARPIIIDGEHLATLFTGQFFYDDDRPDEDYFRKQAVEFGFDETEYLDAYGRVKVYSRDQIRGVMEFFDCLVRMITEMGLKNLDLTREIAVRIAAEEKLNRSQSEVVELNRELERRVKERTLQVVETNKRLQSEIAERERVFEDLQLTQLCVDEASVGIYRISDEGKILYGNRLACEHLGYSGEELCSMSVFDIDPTFDLKRFREHRKLLSRDGSRTFETIHRRKDGSTYPVEVTVNYIDFNGSGFTVSFARDITERKRAEEELRSSRAKYQAIVDSFDGLIYICSQDYRIEFMNRKLIERTGYNAVGEHCYKVMHDRDSVCPWCVNERVFAGETLHWEVLSPKDNCWYYVINVPINHGDGSKSKHSMIIDISDRKKSEDELKEKKKELEELNRTLRQRVRKEVAKNREKDIILIQQNRQAAMGETLEHIIHQWKQPINTIGLLIQILQVEYAKGELSEQLMHETVDKAMDLLQHMTDTADLFTDYYKPETAKRSFEVKAVVQESLSFIAPAFRHRNISVELDADPKLTAYGYPKELQQVLLILLTNARDAFVEKGGVGAKLEVKAFQEGRKAVVTVTDNAGGIPEKALGRVFDLYFTTKGATGGTGIGLYMARGIIEKRMNGSMKAANVEGGAQFRLEIAAAGRAKAS